MTQSVRPPDPALNACPILAGSNPMAPGAECIRPRGLENWLLWLTSDGRCTVRSASGVFETRCEELVLIAPGVPQHYGNPDSHRPWQVTWIIFQPRADWRDLLAWPEMAAGIYRLQIGDPEIGNEIRQALARTVAATRRGSERSVRFAMNALENALLWCDALNPGTRLSAVDPRLERAIQFLCENLAAPHYLDEIAAVAGLSRAQVVRLFRAQTGVAPMRYLENRRLERAIELLEHTPLTIGEIADHIGYPNAFHFSTRFRRLFGRSPSFYRRENRWSE